MKNIVLTVLLFAISLKGFSQDTSTYEKRHFAVKAFVGFQTNGDRLAPQALNGVRLLPAIALTVYNRKQNFHEIQFNELTNYSTPSSLCSFFSSRYSINWVLLKKKHPKIQPILGVGFSPFYYFDSNESNGYYAIKNLTRVGINAEFLPRIQWNLSSKIFLELNVPLRVMNLSYQKTHIDNAMIPTSQSNTWGFNFSSIGSIFHFAMYTGIGIHL